MHSAVQNAREAIKGDPHIIEMRDLDYEAERNIDLLLETCGWPSNTEPPAKRISRPRPARKSSVPVTASMFSTRFACP